MRLRKDTLSSTQTGQPSDSTPIIKEGFLVKAPRAKGNDRVRKGWQERYFVLTQGKLVYYKAKSDKKPKGEILLKQCAVIDTEFQNIFKISELEHKCFTYLRAPSADIKLDWIDKIQKSIAEVVVQGRPSAISTGGFEKTTNMQGTMSAVKRDLVAADMNPESFDNSTKTRVLTDDAGAVYEGGIVDRKKHGWGVLKSQGHRYEGEWSNDKMHGEGVFVHATGVRYEGQWINGKQHGFGTLTFPSGAMYVGGWEDGLRHGKGVMLSVNGGKYDGDFVRGMQHGKGILLWANGNKYEGDFRNNQGHGMGKFEYADGVTFEGEFAYGRFHGHGKLKFNKAREYEGMFVEDAYSGPGTLNFANGDKYEGFCRRHYREGFGVMSWGNGTRYEGDWKNDHMHGVGMFDSPDGHQYEGEFREGFRYGKGRMFFPDGKKYDGNWVDGMMNGTGCMYYPNGNIFEGIWLHGQKEGRGNFVWNDGRKFNGNYKHGKPCGHGVFINAQGERYEGNYVDGKKDGKGQYYFADGSVYDGDWEDNFMHGQGVMNYADGTKYEGEWTKDIRGEKGKFFWPNGDVFDGIFGSEGEFVGGVIQYGNGNRYEGEVLNGKRNGVGVMFWVIGERFEGHWKNGKRHGFGVMFLLDGRITEGNYEDDKCISLSIREKKNDDDDFEANNEFALGKSQEGSLFDSKKSDSEYGADMLGDTQVEKSERNPDDLVEIPKDSLLSPKYTADFDMDIEKNISFETLDRKHLPEDLLASANDGKIELGRYSDVPRTINLTNDRAMAKNIKAVNKQKHGESMSEGKSVGHISEGEEAYDSGSDEEHEKRHKSSIASDSLQESFTNPITIDLIPENSPSVPDIVRMENLMDNLIPHHVEFGIDHKDPDPTTVITPEIPDVSPVPDVVANIPEAALIGVAQPIEIDAPISVQLDQSPIEAQTPTEQITGTSEEIVHQTLSDDASAEIDETKQYQEPTIETPEIKSTEASNSVIDVESTEAGDKLAELNVSKITVKPVIIKNFAPRTSDWTYDLEYVRITDWTIEQTCLWLQKNKFGMFANFFKTNEFDGKFIDGMDLSSLATFDGIITSIQKRNLIFTVEQLKNRQKSRGYYAPAPSGMFWVFSSLGSF